MTMPARQPRNAARGKRSATAATNPTDVRRYSTANLGFEEVLWQTADKLRSTMDAAEYKHVVLGLVFLKHVSEQTTSTRAFTVPAGATWGDVQKLVGEEGVGRAIDTAMKAIERANPKLSGALPAAYANGTLGSQQLGELVDLISSVVPSTEAEHRSDVLGRIYEYFLGKFAAAEGRLGGQFYTPSGVVRLLVEMLQPSQGRVYDPCCGSGGMFVQAQRFVRAHHGKPKSLTVFGQESNLTTWRLARMNLALHGIAASLGDRPADTLHSDLHPTLEADFILANPPFNVTDWGGDRLRSDPRWAYGVPPSGNANFAWVQHFVHHLAPRGIAGFVLANGALSSEQGGEDEIRARLVEADLIDAVVALPPQLFYTTAIPASLWILRKGRSGTPQSLRTLFIDCRGMGTLVDRTHRELSETEIAQVAETYRTWASKGDVHPQSGFAVVATRDTIATHRYVLTPGRYVGSRETTDAAQSDSRSTEELLAGLKADFAKAERLQAEILTKLARMERGS